MPAPAGGLTNAELLLALNRRKNVEERKAAMKDQELTKPPKLTSFKDWVNWWELWDTYMQQTYGMAEIPLSYVYREHKLVTNDMRTPLPTTPKTMTYTSQPRHWRDVITSLTTVEFGTN
jgi:hypothetical protein